MNFKGAIYNGKSKIKNIIFDWGGVITDIHLEATKNAFINLGLSIFDETVPHDPNHDLFIPFEIGKISPAEFRERIKKSAKSALTDEMIDKAWNALLGELPVERWRILEKVSREYRCFILSNTNAIHQPYYFNRIQQMYGTYGYGHLFEKVYFSHELGLRKPNAAIFEYVIKDAGIVPEETMFIDDFFENIETARKLGFQTIYLKPPLSLTDIFE